MCTIDRRWHLEPGDFDSAGRARVDFRELLRPVGTPESDLDAAEIIFGELVTNALRHSGGDADARVRCDRRGFVLEIRDRGAGFDLAKDVKPRGDDCEGGRGIMIAQRLGAELHVERGADACTVEAVLPVVCKHNA